MNSGKAQKLFIRGDLAKPHHSCFMDYHTKQMFRSIGCPTLLSFINSSFNIPLRDTILSSSVWNSINSSFVSKYLASDFFASMSLLFGSSLCFVLFDLCSLKTILWNGCGGNQSLEWKVISQLVTIINRWAEYSTKFYTVSRQLTVRTRYSSRRSPLMTPWGRAHSSHRSWFSVYYPDTHVLTRSRHLRSNECGFYRS